MVAAGPERERPATGTGMELSTRATPESSSAPSSSSSLTAPPAGPEEKVARREATNARLDVGPCPCAPCPCPDTWPPVLLPAATATPVPEAALAEADAAAIEARVEEPLKTMLPVRDEGLLCAARANSVRVSAEGEAMAAAAAAAALEAAVAEAEAVLWRCSGDVLRDELAPTAIVPEPAVAAAADVAGCEAAPAEA